MKRLRLMWLKFKMWVVNRLGGVRQTVVHVPVHYTAQKMNIGDWTELANMSRSCPAFFRFVNVLSCKAEDELRKLDPDPANDRMRLWIATKIDCYLSMMEIPEIATLNMQKLEYEQNAKKVELPMNNFAELTKKGERNE